MGKRALVIGGLLAGCLLLILKPAVVKTDDHAGLLMLFRGQSGVIRFVNSVTGGPVTIHFRIGGRFQDFSVVTDETTEAYYTSGLFSLNEAVSKESTEALRFCSMKGISLRLGFYDFYLKGGCLEAKLLWTK
jgi:hypothetical protein